MYPLKTLKGQLAFLGLLQPPTQRERKLFFVTNVVCFCLNFSYFIPILWFIAFEAKTFAEYTECTFYVMSCIIAIAWYSLILWKRKQYSNLLALIDNTVKHRCEKSKIIESIYHKVNGTVENVTKTVNFVCVRSLTISNMIMYLLVCCCKYYFSRDFNESFILFSYGSYPFDIHTPTGYFMGYIIQGVAGFLDIWTFSIQMFITGGFIWTVSAFTLDVEMCLTLLNIEIKAKQLEILTAQQRIGINKMIGEIIQFHSEAKHFAEDISDLINANIVTYEIYSVTCFCCLLLQEMILFEMKDYLGMMMNMPLTIAPMIWLYLFCHFGSFLSECFSSVGDKIYEVNWYMLSADNQKIWPFLIKVGQKDVILQGFGSSSCTREIFMKIMNTTLSYFMVLRSFDYH